MTIALFWTSVAAAVLIMASGAGRTFTYVNNWYSEDAERAAGEITNHLPKPPLPLMSFDSGNI